MKKKNVNKLRPTGKKILPKKAKAVPQEYWKYYSALAVIILISFTAYLPVLHNSLLTAWDDDGYIRSNSLIYSINLKEIFSQNVMGNYHPLTMLTLATEYHFFGLNETGYHAVNLGLHLLNVLLVFYAVSLLSDKTVVALVASLLFGIHPIHVESVAWAAELKDLLYTFFFLASYIFYLKFYKKRHSYFYALSLLFFLLSLLSKAMAASLPVVLLLTDYLKGRKIDMKVILEKVPFFLLAILLGWVAVAAQKSSDIVQEITLFTFPQHMVFACYGFIAYLYKLLLPLHLSAYYPYPVKDGAAIPIQYYVFVLLFLVLAASIYYSLRFSKKIFFAISFFAVTVFLVLQLLPVGGALMADRYTYIPSIGIFYLAGEGFNLLWSKKQKWIPLAALVVITIFFSMKTFTRTSIWKNEMTLWSDVISQYQTVPLAYYNRGVASMSESKNDQALEDFTKAIELKPGYTQAYVNKGNILRDKNRHEEAIKEYNMAIELNPNFAIAYFNRGTLFMNENKNDEAIDDLSKAIELNPRYYKAFSNRGIVFFNTKRYEEAISDYSNAIALKDDYYEAYYNRGMARYYSGNKDAGCADLQKAANLGFRQAVDVMLQFCK